MTEPTAEQVAREMKEAHGIADRWYTSLAAVFGDGAGNALTDVIATALARVRIEAHAAGRDDGLDAAEMLSRSTVIRWDESPRIAIADAIRALRGRT